MGTKYLPRRLGQHLADAKELTAPRTWNSNSVGVSHGKTDIWSMILPWVYNLYTCDNATWKVYKFPHWMPHNKAICSLYYTICTNCIQLWKGLCTLRVHSIIRIKMRFHAVYLNWRFGVRLKLGKSIRGGVTQPLTGLCGRHSRRRCLPLRESHFRLRRKLLLTAPTVRFLAIIWNYWNCSLKSAFAEIGE